MFKNLGKDLVKAFNTGVSYFLPAVVIGGVFLAFALATGEAGSDGMKVTNGFMQNINTIGSAGMAMMIPMLAGYIAYSLAGKPALAPGMIVGYIANNPVGENNVSTGFLGAMIMGILVGYVCKWIKSWKVGPTIKSIMPVLIIPIISDCFRFDLLPCISLHSGGSSGCIDEGINRYAEWHAGRKCDSSGNRDWCDDRL